MAKPSSSNIQVTRIQYVWLLIKSYTWLHAFLEPVGSVSPKINSISKFDELSVHIGHTLSILCPAQSFPVPSFR